MGDEQAHYEYRPEGGIEFLDKLITPDLKNKSKFHNFLTKDLCIGYFNSEKEAEEAVQYFYLINFAVEMGLDDLADFYSAILSTYINSRRSIKGFERIQENSQYVKQIQGQDKDNEKRSLFK